MTGLVLIVLTTEYIIFSAGMLNVYGGELSVYTWLLLLIGYVFLTRFITCNIHGKRVRVRYEQELSFILKAVVCNVVMSVFLIAIADIVGIPVTGQSGIVLRTCYMTFLQLVSIVIICGIFTMKADKKRRKRLYIYETHFIQCGIRENSEVRCVDECGENLLREKIMECDEVYLYDLSAQRRNDMMKFCFYNHKPVYFTCKLSDMELRSAAIAQDGDRMIFYNESGGIHGISAVIKRIADIMVSLTALIIFSPLFALTAILVKAGDGGPVFYRQTRCTKNRRQFQIIKFRSMVVGAENQIGAKLADKSDSRFTGVGRFLRRTKLDELPQLINILKGDMSIVGPRPERPELIARTIESVPEFSFRTTVKAGLTGYAQVHGDYHTDFLEKLKWDLMYIENFSLLLDFKIILMTIPVLFRGSDDV